MPEIGALLGAKYRVLAKLGEGGMGTVYRAENELTGKQVAIKWMHPQLAANPDAAERMLREARATSRISHPNVVDVYDVVRDNQTLFLVMELLQGETLREYLRNNPQPRLSEFIGLLAGAMAGVAAAHEHGVIHRDLKPDNIFLERIAGIPTPTTKVVDFGIAKLAEIRGSTLTETGAAIGTPVYMSLEQLRGDKDIDVRTDVYAFGVMLYEAVVGRMPYNASTLPELAIKVATTDALGVRNLRPDVPPALAAVIDRAIARDRNQRWPDVHTLLQQLQPFMSDGPTRPTRNSQATGLGLDGRSGWPSPGQSQIAARAWGEATQALPSLPPPLVARRETRHDSVRSDSLTGRELSHMRAPLSHSRPVWIAAGAFLSVSALAAYLLLGGSKPAETSVGAATRPTEIKPPEVIVGPIVRPEIPPPATDPEIPVKPGAPLEEQAELPPIEPLQRPTSVERAPQGRSDRDEPREHPRNSARGRPKNQPERQVASEPSAPRPEPTEPKPKPKNAADVLGF